METEYMENGKVDENGFFRNYTDLYGITSREHLDPESLIQSGTWVLIMKEIPVNKNIRPKKYGIYYALPVIRKGKAGVKNGFGQYVGTEEKTLVGVDIYGRQCAHVYTPEEVKIFPDEYRILTPERLQEYRDCGWTLQEIQSEAKVPLNMNLIEKGRNLTEEEREIIWSLMLEGLTEQQACEEYFLTHHTEAQNTSICYLPTKEILQELENRFGE